MKGLCGDWGGGRPRCGRRGRSCMHFGLRTESRDPHLLGERGMSFDADLSSYHLSPGVIYWWGAIDEGEPAVGPSRVPLFDLSDFFRRDWSWLLEYLSLLKDHIKCMKLFVRDTLRNYKRLHWLDMILLESEVPLGFTYIYSNWQDLAASPRLKFPQFHPELMMHEWIGWVHPQPSPSLRKRMLHQASLSL